MGSGIGIPGVMGGEVCVWTKGQYDVSSSIILHLTLLPHPFLETGQSASHRDSPGSALPVYNMLTCPASYMGVEHGKQFTNSPSSWRERSPSPHHIAFAFI